jgi:hypothetical protein
MFLEVVAGHRLRVDPAVSGPRGQVFAKNRTNNYLTVGGSSWSIPKQMAAAARLAQASMTTPDLS